MSHIAHSREQGLSFTAGGVIFAHGRSDRGLVRERNEDAFAMDADLGLFLVSDGMGGHRGGREASALVAERLPENLKSAWPESETPSMGELESALDEAAVRTARNMRRQSRLNPLLNGMGATLVCALISGDRALIAHMGDSRAYLLRNGFFERLTKDHTVVDLLLDLGRITKSQAEHHPARHTLTRHAGMAGDAALECSLLGLKPGDRLLLCSDGLTNEAGDSEIAELMASGHDPADACNRLIELAKERGGRDNITALVIFNGQAGESRPAAQKPIRIRDEVGFSLSPKASGGKIDTTRKTDTE